MKKSHRPHTTGSQIPCGICAVTVLPCAICPTPPPPCIGMARGSVNCMLGSAMSAKAVPGCHLRHLDCRGSAPDDYTLHRYICDVSMACAEVSGAVCPSLDRPAPFPARSGKRVPLGDAMAASPCSIGRSSKGHFCRAQVSDPGYRWQFDPQPLL
jgi:hypothetical protein